MPTPINLSLQKCFTILGLFSRNRPEITAASLTQELDMNAATAHRLLASLEDVGALTTVGRGRYRLGYYLAELGRLAQETNPLIETVQQVIDDLSRELNESVAVGTLRRDGIVCIASAESDRPISVNTKLGRLLEPHATAQGKLWLAYLSEDERAAYLTGRQLHRFSPRTQTDLDALRRELDDIRRQGYARNRGEREEEIGAVAVPIFGANGKMILSIAVVGMLSRFDDALVDRALVRLRAAAERLKSVSPV